MRDRTDVATAFRTRPPPVPTPEGKKGRNRRDDGPTHKPCLRVANDARTGMPPGIPGGAMCVQRFDDSLNSAIHITYRISLRSSSMPEPRDPLLKVLTVFLLGTQTTLNSQRVQKGPVAGTGQGTAWVRGPTPGGLSAGPPRQQKEK